MSSSKTPLTAEELKKATGGSQYVPGTAGDDNVNRLISGDPNTSYYVDAGAGNDFANLSNSNVSQGVNAGAGNDTVYTGAGSDNILAGEGNDYVSSGAGNDVVQGEGGNDDMFGGAGQDNVLGGAGNDFLDGGSGADNIEGGTGNDFIVGGYQGTAGDGARDVAHGGDGSDTFVWSPGSGSDYYNGDDASGRNDGGQDAVILSGMSAADVQAAMTAPGSNYNNVNVQVVNGEFRFTDANGQPTSYSGHIQVGGETFQMMNVERVRVA